jgi:hypothetical protein
MALVEIFLNTGLSTYEGRFANYNRYVFEYESKLTGEDAAEEAYKIINSAGFELNEEELAIQEEYLTNTEATLTCGDVVAVDDVPYICLSIGWKKM